MTKIKFDMNIMKFMSLFETMTRARLKDCIDEKTQIIFIVDKGEMGKALGKKGANVKNLEKALRKKIKIIEYNDDLLNFSKNVVAPLKLTDMKEEDGVVTLIPKDSMTRGMLIGKNAVNLRFYESIVKRYFPIKELKVGQNGK